MSVDQISSMNQEEKKLLEYMLTLDRKYFSDMKLITREITKKLGKWPIKVNGKCEYIYEEFPYWLVILTDIEKWKIQIVKKLERNTVGKCLKRKKTVRILCGLSNQDKKYVLLHELIHIYEFFYEKSLRVYSDWLILFLYEKLEKKINPEKLKKFINFECNFYMASESRYRSYHSLLFLLKSLDLDSRLKKDWGTIYSYNREKFFNRRR